MLTYARSSVVGFCVLGLMQVAAADPVDSRFTYQGAIKANGTPVNNTSPGCDCTFSLWDDPSAGSQLGVTQTLNGVPISNGFFTVELNSGNEFGFNAFDGDKRYLEIAVACPSGGALTLLSPRQPITATPYAVHALNVPDGHSLDASDGSLVDALFVDNNGDVGIGTTTPAQKLTVDGNIELTNSGGGRTIGLPIVNFGGRDLTIQAGGNASSHNTIANGGNLILKAGDANRSGGGNCVDLGTQNNNVMIMAGDNVFGGACGKDWNGDIMFFAGDGQFVAQPERMRIVGNSGHVGIGTTSPLGIFDVSSILVVGNDCHRTHGPGCSSPGCEAIVCGLDSFCCNTAWDGACVSSANNNCVEGVGVGRTGGLNALEVEGNASKTTAGDWLANSDARIKTDVTTITNALETIEQLRPVKFRYTDDYKAAHPSVREHEYVNYVAQEFREVFPDQVQSGGEGGILQVDTYPAGVYAVAAIQELHKLVRQKDAELARMEAEKDARITEFTERLERMEVMLNAMIDSKQEVEK